MLHEISIEPIRCVRDCLVIGCGLQLEFGKLRAQLRRQEIDRQPDSHKQHRVHNSNRESAMYDSFPSTQTNRPLYQINQRRHQVGKENGEDD